MATKKEDFYRLHCPKCTAILRGIGLAGTTVFTCLSCGSGWTIDDNDVPTRHESKDE